MNHELAKTLTTALVQFIDRERPEGTMDCSNGECVSLEKAFTDENFDSVETLIKKKLSRLTEFETHLKWLIENGGSGIEHVKVGARELLALAKKELPMPEDTVIFQKGVEEGRRLEREEIRLKFYGNTEPVPTVNGPLCLRYGGICSNPMRDCINCIPTLERFNTTSGTSTATLHGNTSATDGKDHNPSFID